ncbi:MAG TPA: DUF488 domain-containing protein [Solirubrobacterales bacterium]|jgi:uncharacterized protein (DUF488 family)|nr:DUF488 domain-containing protein [Solirubrobacterales bacterium]
MPEVRPQLYTVGHSTLSIEEFLSLLTGAGVKALVDVRRFPGSRRHPQFGADALADSLRSVGIDYESFREELGGRRSRKDVEGTSVTLPDNSAWRNSSFRAYADYMSTPAFATGLERLEVLGRERPTAFMCAEAHPSRCHRRLIADTLLARGWRVVHILSGGREQEHTFTPDAVVDGDRVHYPAQPSLDL